MSITQISIFLENKVGQLAQVCKVLADNDVSLVTLSLAETADFGIARLVVDDTAKAEDVLRRNKYIVKATPVVAVAVPDRPGGMAEVVSTLSAKGCDIEYSYAFALRHGGGPQARRCVDQGDRRPLPEDLPRRAGHPSAQPGQDQARH